MGDKSAAVTAFDGGDSILMQIHGLREAMNDHARDDRAEFAAIRKENAEALGELRLQVSDLGGTQKTIASNQETIMRALGLAAAHETVERRRKPLAMMGQWEGLLKLAGAFTGLMMMLKMIEAAAPSIGHSAVAIWHAILAMNHVAVG